MRISGKVDHADVKDARRLLLGKFYWTRFLLHPSALGYAGALGFVARRSCLHRNWVEEEIAAVVVMAFLVFHFFTAHRFRDERLKRLNAALPDSIIILPNGVQFEFTDGETAFIPWTRYRAYREGERVIWLQAFDKR